MQKYSISIVEFQRVRPLYFTVPSFEGVDLEEVLILLALSHPSDVSRLETRVCGLNVGDGGVGAWEITKANIEGQGDVRKELNIFANLFQQNLQGNVFWGSCIKEGMTQLQIRLNYQCRHRPQRFWILCAEPSS